MTVFPLRPCTPELDLALRSGQKLWRADLFTFNLADGITTYYWTSFDSDILVGSTLFSSRSPYVNCGRWNLTNTMEIPTLLVKLKALNSGFNGGTSIKQQISEGLFDGATFLLSRAYMLTPQATNVLGVIDLFGGFTAGIDVFATGTEITVKGKNNILGEQAPKNVFQVSCIHAFCDLGCTLNRATFTTTYAVGSSPAPTSQFLPWTSAPGNATNYRLGTVRMTTGAAAGQARTVVSADSSGLTLIYPLYTTPSPGDSFTAFEGCDKTKDSGSGQDCAARSNEQNWRAFKFLPPPNAAT